MSHANAKHTTAGPSGLRIAFVLIVLLALPLLIIGALVSYYQAQNNPSVAREMSEEAVTARIQKVGSVTLGEASRGPKTGEEVFQAQCTTCHTAGLLGAPKFADAPAWAPRLASGYEALLKSALKGKNNMTAQGGGAFSDLEVARALIYMANAAGGKFAEIATPNASAPSAAASANR